MADNKPILDGTEASFDAALDELSDSSFSPKATLLDGTGSPIPISPATSGKQDTGNASLASILAALGTPVLPADAATATAQTTGNAALANIETAVEAIQPAVAGTLTVSLPTGAATAAHQVTIIGHVDGIETALGTANAALAAIDGHVDGIEGLLAGTLTVGLPSGASTAANQATMIGHLDGVETALGLLATAAGQATIIGHVDGIEALLTTIDGRVDGLETIGTATNTKLDTVIGHVDGVETAIGSTNTKLDTIDGRVDGIEGLLGGTGSLKDNGPNWTSIFGVAGAAVTSADAQTPVAVTAAPTSGQKIVVTDIFVATDTAMWIELEEETSATILLKFYLPANGSMQITPRGKMKLATADKKLMVDASVAGNIAVTVFYYSEA